MGARDLPRDAVIHADDIAFDAFNTFCILRSLGGINKSSSYCVLGLSMPFSSLYESHRTTLLEYMSVLEWIDYGLA